MGSKDYERCLRISTLRACRDFEESRDTVVLHRTHNSEFAGKPFSRLPTDIKQQLLTYELSTHVFPPTTGDQLVFRIFSRLNSTGLSLNEQEVRNSEFHGVFKSMVYELAFDNLDYWRDWRVFSNEAISRMYEVEAVSEYVLAMINGVTGKSQKKISDVYGTYEGEFPPSEVIQQRFNKTVGAIHESVGDIIGGSAFSRAALSIYRRLARIKPFAAKSLPFCTTYSAFRF